MSRWWVTSKPCPDWYYREISVMVRSESSVTDCRQVSRMPRLSPAEASPKDNHPESRRRMAASQYLNPEPVEGCLPGKSVVALLVNICPLKHRARPLGQQRQIRRKGVVRELTTGRRSPRACENIDSNLSGRDRPEKQPTKSRLICDIIVLRVARWATPGRDTALRG